MSKSLKKPAVESQTVHETMPPGAYYVTKAQDRITAMKAEVKAAQESAEKAAAALNAERLDVLIPKAALKALTAAGFVRKEAESRAKITYQLIEESRKLAEVEIGLPYHCRADPDYAVRNALQKRLDNFPCGISAAANFAKFCVFQTGTKSGESLPVPKLDELWVQWVNFTCGSKP